MKISYNWLKQFVEFDNTPEEIAEIVTTLGLEVEDITHVVRNIKGVVVGKVLETWPHPNADKLTMTKVDTGDQVLEIACGAPNCRADILVPVATEGTQIGEITIEKRKLRGVLSEGMIMSEAEMNLTDDHSGILILDDGYEKGKLFEDYVEREDWIFTLEITVNRPDALSHYGVARELAAYFRKPLKLPVIKLAEDSEPIDEKVSVTIKDPEQGPRYVARMVKDVTVKPSPLWMKALLHSLGQRPINNIVDISNFVLFEIGHPNHMFDYRLVKNGEIIVRLAEKDEKLVTLDGQKRNLHTTDLLISDPEKAVGLAGVMGGENSEVEEDTKDVLIEAAYFDPVTIRKTSKRLGLSTEASRRFERGADPDMAIYAVDRCAWWINRLAGGKTLKGNVDAYPVPVVRPIVTIRTKKTEQILGISLTTPKIKDVLTALKFDVVKEDQDGVSVQVPSFRPDIEREIDLIEEVARLVGYNNIPDAEESVVVLAAPDSPDEILVDSAVETLVGLGFREAVTSGMVSGEDQKNFWTQLQPEKIIRSINPEMNVYRACLVPSLLRVLEHNLNRGIEDVRIFEVGQAGGKGWLSAKADQRSHIALVVSGNATRPNYDRSSQLFDFYDLKGVAQVLVEGLSLPVNLEALYQYFSDDVLEQGFKVSLGDMLKAGVLDKKEVINSDSNDLVLQGGLMRRSVSEKFNIEVPVFTFEADLTRLKLLSWSDLKRPGAIKPFEEIPRYPAVERDLAFVAPASISARDIFTAIQSRDKGLLEKLDLFDYYTGKPLPVGYRSLGFRLTFRKKDCTLQEKEIAPVVKKMIKAVENLEGVSLRT